MHKARATRMPRPTDPHGTGARSKTRARSSNPCSTYRAGTNQATPKGPKMLQPVSTLHRCLAHESAWTTDAP
eukprot:9109109-Alexandrium_andersonii.AAC.1